MAQTVKREEVETNENDSLANRSEPNRPIKKKKKKSTHLAHKELIMIKYLCSEWIS